MRVAVLAGGRSSEHEVSLASGSAVRDGLAAAGHVAEVVEIDRSGVWRRGGTELELHPGRGLPDFDVVFPALHGPFGEDGVVQGLLESLDVAYVGSGVAASAVCMDKVLFKELMAPAGIPQVDFRVLSATVWNADRRVALRSVSELGLPVFVKPARLGSSVGIAKVSASASMASAVDAAFAHDPLVIVEAMGSGVEVECSVLGDTDDPVVSDPGEIVLSSEWYDFEAKYSSGGMQLMVPARISPAAGDQVRKLAAETFTRAGCHGLARVDFFVESDRVLVNELNTMPGFTPTSVFAKLFDASGISYPELVDRLCRLALERRRVARTFLF